MALFFLSYDLRNKRDYQPFMMSLKSLMQLECLNLVGVLSVINTNAKGLRDLF